MEATAESPHFLAEVGKPYRFTKQNAAEFAKRSHAPTSLRHSKPVAAQSQPQPTEQGNEIKDNDRARELETVNRQLAMADEMVFNCADGKELQAIANSIRVFFERKCVLAGIHKPAPMKAAPAKRAKSTDLPQPE